MAARPWTDYLFDLAPSQFKGYWASRLLGGLLGVPTDTVAHANVEAGAVGVFKSNVCPLDVLAHVGNERMLVKYPNETSAAYKARLANAWNIWLSSGSPSAMVDQLSSAGFPNCMIQRDFSANAGDTERGCDAFPSSADYWSSFVLVVPRAGYYDELDTARYFDESPPWTFDGFPVVYWGNGSSIVNRETMYVIKSIVKKWKPVDFICRAIVILPPVVTATYLSDPAYLTDSESLWSSTGVELHGAT
jgi:hypothetical protein